MQRLSHYEKKNEAAPLSIKILHLGGKMAKLHFRFGTMESAKTATCLMLVHNFKEKGNSVILCKPDIDTRTEEVWSRTGLNAPSISVTEMLSLPEEDIAKCKAIVIDEAQFMEPEQVDRLAYFVDELDIPVFCFGLRTDYTSKLFPGAKRLFELADDIEELHTSCWCGKSAKFNARINDGKVVKEAMNDTTIDIENKSGVQKYTALCRKHYLSGIYQRPNQDTE